MTASQAPFSKRSYSSVAQFVAVEFLVFLSQVVTIFLVTFFITDMLSNETRLTEFVTGKLNANTMVELGLTLFAVTFVFGVMAIIKEVASAPVVEFVASEVMAEIPRTIYLFGSTITAVTIAVEIYLSRHPGAIKEAHSNFAAMSVFFAFTFFVYGCGAKYLLQKKSVRRAAEAKGVA